MHEQVTCDDAYLLSVIEKTTVKSKSYAPVLAWRHNIPNKTPHPPLLSYSGYRVAGGGGGLLQTGLLLRKDLTEHDALGALLCLFWMMKSNWGEKL